MAEGSYSSYLSTIVRKKTSVPIRRRSDLSDIVRYVSNRTYGLCFYFSASV